MWFPPSIVHLLVCIIPASLCGAFQICYETPVPISVQGSGARPFTSDLTGQCLCPPPPPRQRVAELEALAAGCMPSEVSQPLSFPPLHTLTFTLRAVRFCACGQVDSAVSPRLLCQPPPRRFPALGEPPRLPASPPAASPRAATRCWPSSPFRPFPTLSAEALLRHPVSLPEHTRQSRSRRLTG